MKAIRPSGGQPPETGARPGRRLTWTVLLAMLAALMLVGVTACGGDDSDDSGGGAADTSDSASSSEPKSVVVFLPSTAETYHAKWRDGAKAEAEQAGWTIKFIENDFSQTEQDVQVQQQLSSGDEVDLYVWWAADSEAGLASLRQLMGTGTPVFLANVKAPPGTPEDSFTLYTGVDDSLIGQQNAEQLIELRDTMKEDGQELSGEGGNLIMVNLVPGYQAGIDRAAALRKALKGSGITVLDEQNSEGGAPENGFDTASQMIPRFKAQGIDFAWSAMDALSAGTINALEDAGYKPGTDVGVVAGNCHGRQENLENGKQYATNLQGPEIEGTYAMIVAQRYFSGDGTVEPGSNYAEPDPDAAPDVTGPVYKFDYIPTPKLLGADLESLELWGATASEACDF